MLALDAADAAMGETFQELWVNLHRTETYFKLAVVIALAPIWFPFLKALLQEANEDMHGQGGLLGRVPGPTEAALREREAALRPHPLVNEPRPGAGSARGVRTAGRTRSTARLVDGGGFGRARRRGF